MKIVNQNVELIDHMGSDLSVVNAARVSFSKFHDVFEEGKDVKLISYLAKHNHWSPFAHAFLSFRIKSPIFVARQLVKHQVGLSWNEVSRRYVDDEPEFYFPDVWRGKPVNAKQGSSDAVVTQFMAKGSLSGQEVPVEIKWATEHSGGIALLLYNHLIDAGVAPEQARMILPQNMMTEWLWSGSLAAFARVCKLRLDPHAQAETREVAEKINALVPNSFSHSWRALLDTGSGVLVSPANVSVVTV